MAQPLFDEHPLEEYFRKSGEGAEDMPGGVPEFAAEMDVPSEPTYAATLHERLLSFLVRLLQMVNTLFSSSKSSPESTFAERFKYSVISSSLLSTSIAVAPTSATRRASSPEVPGQLNEPATPTTEDQTSALVHDQDGSVLDDFEWPVTLASIAAAALSAEYYFIAIFLFGGATYTRHISKTKHERADAISLTLSAASELVAAYNVWDSSVNEAITIIETEERSLFYGPTSPQSPSSSLRVTLQSSLHTTQTQCDNVRQLLSALTDPTQLAQLSEMYAPASPVKATFSILDNPRPVSVPLPAWRQRNNSLSTPPTDKRATWNGSYASLALAGSPTAHLLKRKAYRMSDLSSLFDAQASRQASVSAPASPQVAEMLQDVQEEDGNTDSDMDLSNEDHFGAAALGLQRKRRSAGMEVFGIPPPGYSSAASTPWSKRSSVRALSPPTFTSSTRLTPVHTTRHPLSLSGLHLALHGALSAKRYACSHLLALRFDDDEDEAYWEDVRSVMALLTSTFEDASSRLDDALSATAESRKKDQRPSPGSHSRTGSASISMRGVRPARTMAEMVSFAPMPSHLTRFAAHVDAISSALNDAREYLEQCVASLRDSVSEEAPQDITDVQEHPAFQAYDRLRKELGYALRECERGRERLLDIVSPPALGVSVEDDGEDTPALGVDDGSDASERAGPSSPARQHEFAQDIEVRLSEAPGHDEDLDDATSHLLLTASTQHLPPPGIEQVFEAEAGLGGAFSRERSKLTREERIQLAKTRRESGVLGATPAEPPRVGERWGPGGEVVQELKDVIWKVSEKRRRMSERLGARVEAEVEADDANEAAQRTEHSQAPAQPGPTSGGPMFLFS